MSGWRWALPLIALGLSAVDARAQVDDAVAPTVLAVHPHDSDAFTQGLLWHDGRLYESTGRYGASSLREVDPVTGEVLRSVAIAATYFGEGLARVPGEDGNGDLLYQLTWREGVVLVYGLESFDQVTSFTYDGEGWGLCFDGDRLVMSDGSATLSFRSAATFALTGSVEVTLDGAPQSRLNELECVGDVVYANVWQSDRILRIDAGTGLVTAVVDGSALLTAQEEAAADVLNGIAFDREGGHFFLTGKLWPKLFEVDLGAAGVAIGNDGPPAPVGEIAGGCAANRAPLAVAWPLLVLSLGRLRLRRARRRSR